MYLTHVDIDGNLIFVMVLPFEQKHLARQYGFVWNNVLPGAWATDNQATALAAVKANRAEIVVTQDLINLWLTSGKMLPETHAAFSDRLAAYHPDRKMKAAIEAATMSDDMITAVHTGLQTIASVCDGATTEDAQGFNRNDLEYGHGLAEKSQLTRADAGYGKLLLHKYRRQLGHELYSLIFPEVYAREAQAAEDKANKKAAKAAEKFHKKGKACDWSGCQQCTQMPGEQQTAYVAAVDYVQAGEVQEVVQAVSEVIKDGLHNVASQLAQKAAERVLAPCTAETMASGYCVTCGEYHAQGMAVGSYNPVENITQVTKPAAVVIVNYADANGNQIKLPEADPEIIRLATSLIDCYGSEFDAIVDMLRDLRGIDAPKEGSAQVKDMWQAAGYKTK